MKGPSLCPQTSHHSHSTRQVHLVQGSHNACRSLHSMPPAICILISNESQSCCSFNKLPLLPPSLASTTVLSHNRVLSNMLQAYLNLKNKKYTKTSTKIFSPCCANTAKIPHPLINEEFWLTHLQKKLNGSPKHKNDVSLSPVLNRYKLVLRF